MLWKNVQQQLVIYRKTIKWWIIHIISLERNIKKRKYLQIISAMIDNKREAKWDKDYFCSILSNK